MSKKIMILIIASILCLVAAPILYIGGKGGNTGLIMFGLAIFIIGMGMPPVQRFFTKKKVEKHPITR